MYFISAVRISVWDFLDQIRIHVQISGKMVTPTFSNVIESLPFESMFEFYHNSHPKKRGGGVYLSTERECKSFGDQDY